MPRASQDPARLETRSRLPGGTVRGIAPDSGPPRQAGPAALPRVEDAVRFACVLEATARKPGNVHPQAGAGEVSHADFLRSAAAVAPVLARAVELGVGRAILESIERTQETVGTNTNLGIVLLLAPLAAVPSRQPLRAGIGAVLAGLTQADAALVYRAIRLAGAGGLGRVDQQDVSAEPTVTLIEAMQLAAGRDTVAEQYVNGFTLVLGFGLPILERRTDFTENWEEAVIDLHLRLMAHRPDTLIARKCGHEIARESARRAADVLDAGWPRTPAGHERLQQLDEWLRANRNRRNPGTTADLVAACLFASFREGTLKPPVLEIDDA